MTAPELFRQARERARQTSAGPAPGGAPGGDRERSAWERLIETHVADHAQYESAFVDAYREVAARYPDAYVRYLANFLAEEEDRHHRLFASMLAELRPTSEQPSPLRVPARARRADLIVETSRLIAAERRNADDLRRIRRELRAMEGHSLLPLMTELLELDCAKHLHILRYIRRHAGGTRLGHLGGRA